MRMEVSLVLLYLTECILKPPGQRYSLLQFATRLVILQILAPHFHFPSPINPFLYKSDPRPTFSFSLSNQLFLSDSVILFLFGFQEKIQV